MWKTNSTKENQEEEWKGLLGEKERFLDEYREEKK
jgi:hypothetical protein